MIDVPVTSVVSQDASQVSPATSTVEAARSLRKPDVPALVVCDEAATVVGILTESDVVAVVAERGGNQPVSAYMSTPVETVGPSTTVGLAADRMRDAGVCHLPVVDDADTYLGLVTREGLAPYIPRYRLEVDWDREPLTLEGGTTNEAGETGEPGESDDPPDPVATK